ncbi:NAD(P)-binding protein [Thalassovita sp.]|uniref:NAD(P)-binding protein n=1 Tax=Thalassovita sp. TaxID=1979401 RepID=UPI00288264EB|nr:NAD(P)-binding protein [Thalassovita sp.]MDF1802119.1 NAD(P)-binding protein [Thalassovita sp.]
MTQPSIHDTSIIIVGAGFGGLGTEMCLKETGFDDFVMLERADDVGGAWRDNTYPGVACDVPSHLYSFSYMPKPGWCRISISMPACKRPNGTPIPAGGWWTRPRANGAGNT